MDWIYRESFWLFCPDFTDVFIRREAAERFQAPSVVICVDEVCEMGAQLIVVVIMVAFDGGVFDRSVHAFYLAIGPGMSDFC